MKLEEKLIDNYHKGYNDGYHRAMLDYGLEDDLCKWEQIRAEIQKEADNRATPYGMEIYYRCLSIIDKHLNVSEVWER